MKWRLRKDNSTFSKIEGDSTKEKPRNHTVTYSYILYRTCMWKVMVLQRFYGCFFCSSKEKKYCGCNIDTLHKEPDLNQQEIYCVLAEELIDNNIRRKRGTRRSQRDPQNMRSASYDTMNLIPELRATKAKKRHKNGTMTKFCKQGRCRMCYKGRPTTICSVVMITTVKSSIFVIHKLAEIALNCMSNKSICKNKKCYLLLIKIFYIIIVFKIYI